MEDQARLLLADDEPSIRETYAELLEMGGHQVDTAGDGQQVVEKVRAVPYDLLLMDLVFPPTDGIHVLREVKRIRPSMLVVLFSGQATVETVLGGFRSGAFDFLEKPVPQEKLMELASRALEIRTMGDQRRKLAEELESERLRSMQLRKQLGLEDSFHKIVGTSPSIQSLVDTIREVSRTDSTVLITGER